MTDLDVSFGQENVFMPEVGGAQIGGGFEEGAELALTRTPLASLVRSMNREGFLKPNDVSKEDAYKELAEVGLADYGPRFVTDRGINRDLLDQIKLEGELFNVRQNRVAVSSNTFAGASANLAGAMAAEVADPFNFTIGAAGGAMFSVGAKLTAATRLGRAAQRARVAAAEGAVGEIAVQPLRYLGASIGDTYGAADSIADIALSSLFSGAVGAVGGFASRQYQEAIDAAPEEFKKVVALEAADAASPELLAMSNIWNNLEPDARQNVLRVINAQAAAGKADIEVADLLHAMGSKNLNDVRAQALASGLREDYMRFIDQPEIQKVISDAQLRALRQAEGEGRILREQVERGDVEEALGEAQSMLEADDGTLGSAFRMLEQQRVLSDVIDQTNLTQARKNQLQEKIGERVNDLEQKIFDRSIDIEPLIEIPEKTIDNIRAAATALGKQIDAPIDFVGRAMELVEAIRAERTRVQSRAYDLTGQFIGDLYGPRRMEKSDMYRWLYDGGRVESELKEMPAVEFDNNGTMTLDGARSLDIQTLETNATADIELSRAELESIAPGLADDIIARNQKMTDAQARAYDEMATEGIECLRGIVNG